MDICISKYYTGFRSSSIGFPSRCQTEPDKLKQDYIEEPRALVVTISRSTAEVFGTTIVTFLVDQVARLQVARSSLSRPQLLLEHRHGDSWE